MKEAEMVPCDHVIAKLWEYVDGELGEEQAEKIRAHLEICGRCFPQYNFQRAYKEFIRRSGEQPLPPGLRRRVFEAILAEESGQPLSNGASADPEAEEGMLDRVRATFARLFGGGDRNPPG
jgi:anti-sigma factor (TIGR02949 family)